MILSFVKHGGNSEQVSVLAIAISLFFMISGCSNSLEVDCGGKTTISAVENMLQQRLEDSVRKQLDSEGSIDGYDSAKLRVGTKQIKVVLADVRTIKKDPDSSRKFCSARLQLTLPNNVVEAANSARSIADMSDVKKLAHENRIDRDGNKYGRELEYSIQPTDDGKKIIAETDEDSSLFTFLTELFSSYLLSEEVRNKAIEADKAAAADAREERRAEEEVSSARNEQALATLDESKVQNRMANERINAVWASIPKSTKDRLRELQRAWIRKAAAKCKLEAAGKSDISAEREAIRLRCDTSEQLARASQLERFVSYEDNSASRKFDASARAGEDAATDAAATAEEGADAAAAAEDE